jgi:hypothetical protein
VPAASAICLRAAGAPARRRSQLMWSAPDVIGLFSLNLVSFSPNVAPSAQIYSINLVPKPPRCNRSRRWMLSKTKRKPLAPTKPKPVPKTKTKPVAPAKRKPKVKPTPTVAPTKGAKTKPVVAAAKAPASQAKTSFVKPTRVAGPGLRCLENHLLGRRVTGRLYCAICDR